MPWPVVARDVLLTMVAWALLLYFLRDLLWMAAYWSLATLDVDLLQRWAPGEMWRDTLPFLKVVGLLVLWLAVSAVARWRLLTNRVRAARDPAPLEAIHHAAVFGLSNGTLKVLQGTRIATLQICELSAEGRGWHLEISQQTGDLRSV